VRRAAAELFHHPDFLHAGLLDIQNAGAGQTVGQQGFGILEAQAVDHPVLFGTQSGAESLGQFGVGGQHKKRFHLTCGPDSVRYKCWRF
jgi:hypothetical protein